MSTSETSKVLTKPIQNLARIHRTFTVHPQYILAAFATVRPRCCAPLVLHAPRLKSMSNVRFSQVSI